MRSQLEKCVVVVGKVAGRPSGMALLVFVPEFRWSYQRKPDRQQPIGHFSSWTPRKVYTCHADGVFRLRSHLGGSVCMPRILGCIKRSKSNRRACLGAATSGGNLDVGLAEISETSPVVGSKEAKNNEIDGCGFMQRFCVRVTMAWNC